MKRRQFITLIGGAAAAWPLAARAQQNKIPVVGVLWHAGSAEEEEVYLSVLMKAFSDLGYVQGKNIQLDQRFPDHNHRRCYTQKAYKFHSDCIRIRNRSARVRTSR
jgi:putative tryptophan/tyrosine transport system substrate-binding protein